MKPRFEDFEDLTVAIAHSPGPDFCGTCVIEHVSSKGFADLLANRRYGASRFTRHHDESEWERGKVEARIPACLSEVQAVTRCCHQHGRGCAAGKIESCP